MPTSAADKPAHKTSANNGVTIALAISIDKLTHRLKLTKEESNDSVTANVIVQVSLSVVHELYNHLVSISVESDVANVGRGEVGRLEEHL